MRKLILSAALGVLLACTVFWSFDFVEGLRQASDLAKLQSQEPDEWLTLSPVQISNGESAASIEPIVTWTIEPKRLLELRVAVNTRDVANGTPVCIGGTVTFIIEPADATTFTRPLSRIAGVDRCDWPPGEYRSRFTWTMTDPASRVVKTIFQESEPFSVN